MMKLSSIIPCCCSIVLLSLEANGFSIQQAYSKSTPLLHTNSPASTSNSMSTGAFVDPVPTSFMFRLPSLTFIGMKMSRDDHETTDASEDEEEDEADTPIPFVDIQSNNFIECYTESVATVKGVQYTIGVPCDHAVALCSFDTDDQLVPIDLDDPLMDDIYPVAESIVEDEFGDELVLQRTPQTLTLVGELDDGDDDDDEEEAEDDEDDSEEVEILLSFEHKGTEYSLVRLLDPILLVGKEDPANSSRRILLTPDEADEVMPALEEIFMREEEE